MNIGDVYLQVKANLSSFRASLAGLNSQVSRSATQMGEDLMKVGRGLSKTGGALTRNLTVPILAAGGAVTHFALDFDTSMRRIVGLAKVPQSEIAGVRDSILKMATDIGRAPQDLADAFYFVASAGFEAEEAMQVLEISAKASAAGMGEVSDVAKVLGGVINAYGHENLSAARAGDVLTAAVQDGAAEASNFAVALGNVVPTAAQVGVSFDQVTAAMAAMTNVGIGAETSAVNLNQIFTSLLKPTNEASDALTSVGLSAAGLRQQLREQGLVDTLRTLSGAFGDNEAAIAKVFGNIRALRGVNALLGLDQQQLNGIFHDTASALGTLNGAYKDTEGPQRELDRAMASLQATAIEFGRDVLPTVVDVLKQVAETAKDVAGWWKSLDAGTRSSIVHWLAFAATVGPILLVVGKLVSGLGAMFKAVGFLTGAKGIPALVKWLSLGRLALLGWAGAMVVVLSHGDDITLFTDQLLNGAKATAKLKKLFDVTGNMGFAIQLREAGVSAEDVTHALEVTGTSAENFFDVWEKGGRDFGKTVDQLSLDSDTAAKGIFAGWGPRGPAALAAIEAARTAKQIPENVSAALVDGKFEIQEAAEDTADPIAEAFEKARQDAAESTRNLMSDLAKILAAGPEDIKDEVQAIIDAVKDPFTTLERTMSLSGALAKAGFRAGFTKDDPKLAQDTFDTAMDLLAQFDLLKPGVFDVGAEVPTEFQAGVNSTLESSLTYFKSIRPDLIDPWDIADELNRLGYHVLAEYVLGLERTRQGELTRKITAIQRDLHEKLDIDMRTEGESTVKSYAAGLLIGLHDVTQAGRTISGRLGGFLEFSGSPPYTHSREIGEKVGLTYAQGIVASIRGLIPGIAASVGSIASAMSAQPFGLATAAVPSMSATAANASALQTGIRGGDSYTFDITVQGVGSDVSTQAARRFGQQILDEVATGLQEQGSRFGNRPRVNMG